MHEILYLMLVIVVCVCVLQQAFTELDQRKVSLLETCKRLMRRASEICNMSPGETVVPEILHTVRTHTLFFFTFMCHQLS